MAEAVILAGVRTPVGRYGGALSEHRPDDLAALAIAAAVERAGVEAGEIEDVYFGCANQAGEDNRNVARMAALLAGLPETVAGVTVNRLCASGLSAVVSACHAIRAGEGELFVAGGVESMTRAPLVMAKPDRAYERGDRTVWDTTLGWRFPNPRLEEKFPLESMGETGENVAERWSVSRDDQDGFALESQRRHAAAAEAGRFRDELVSVDGIDADEHPRADTTLEKLSSLKPAFREGGTVTAGNSSGLNDGAAALVVASQEKARELGLEPLGRFVASAVAGVDPRVMGIGPIPAVRKALARAGVEVADLDLVELNEAFASQSLHVIRELGLDPGRVNVNGGAIAVGHPLGMSGARLVVTLLHELGRRGGRYGLATLCVGIGQGQAAVFERTDDLRRAETAVRPEQVIGPPRRRQRVLIPASDVPPKRTAWTTSRVTSAAGIITRWCRRGGPMTLPGGPRSRARRWVLAPDEQHPADEGGMMTTISHAPSANLATAKMTVTMPVATAPKPLIAMLRRQPSPRSRRQWTTIPACDSVIEVNTPMAYSGISASTRPPNAARTTIDRTASATIPVLNASRSPRNANRLGMNPSRARSDDRRGKSAKDVLAARTRMPIVESCRT